MICKYNVVLCGNIVKKCDSSGPFSQQAWNGLFIVCFIDFLLLSRLSAKQRKKTIEGIKNTPFHFRSGKEFLVSGGLNTTGLDNKFSISFAN